MAKTAAASPATTINGITIGNQYRDRDSRNGGRIVVIIKFGLAENTVVVKNLGNAHLSTMTFENLKKRFALLETEQAATSFGR